jgi:hypothetical protein
MNETLLKMVHLHTLTFSRVVLPLNSHTLLGQLQSLRHLHLVTCRAAPLRLGSPDEITLHSQLLLQTFTLYGMQGRPVLDPFLLSIGNLICVPTLRHIHLGLSKDLFQLIQHVYRHRDQFSITDALEIASIELDDWDKNSDLKASATAPTACNESDALTYVLTLLRVCPLLRELRLLTRFGISPSWNPTSDAVQSEERIFSHTLETLRGSWTAALDMANGGQPFHTVEILEPNTGWALARPNLYLLSRYLPDLRQLSFQIDLVNEKILDTLHGRFTKLEKLVIRYMSPSGLPEVGHLACFLLQSLSHFTPDSRSYALSALFSFLNLPNLSRFTSIIPNRTNHSCDPHSAAMGTGSWSRVLFRRDIWDRSNLSCTGCFANGNNGAPLF